jgi:hypothetical protein
MFNPSTIIPTCRAGGVGEIFFSFSCFHAFVINALPQDAKITIKLLATVQAKKNAFGDHPPKALWRGHSAVGHHSSSTSRLTVISLIERQYPIIFSYCK